MDLRFKTQAAAISAQRQLKYSLPRSSQVRGAMKALAPADEALGKLRNLALAVQARESKQQACQLLQAELDRRSQALAFGDARLLPAGEHGEDHLRHSPQQLALSLLD